MEFQILGPLRVRGADGAVVIRGRHHPKVLALLLDEANRVVPFDRLVEALWDGSPPATAPQQIQNVVGQLRRQLEAGSARLRTVGGGYRFEVSAEESDALRCKAAADRARKLRRAGRSTDALGALHQALSEWSGPSLAGLSGRLVESIAHRWDEFRLSLLEERLDLELDAGRHENLIAEIRQLVSDHPLRQRFAEQLMLALYRSGRAPEALQVFADTGERLSTSFGLDPGPALRDLQVAILREDPALHGPRTEPSEAGRPRPARDDRLATVPAMLPGALPGFSRRTAPLRALDRMLRERLLAERRSPGLAAITGPGGIGKSTLAIHWAHEVAWRFPDGQLFLDLRGFDPHSPPLTAAEAVRSLLDALGVPPTRMPSDEASQIGLYRSLVSDRRLLVLLDNARDASQVRPLLPGGHASFTVVTSRNRLLGLAAAQGARTVDLGLLDADDAYELLERRLGSERVRAEPEAVEDLIAACMGLPLALAIAASRATTQPDFPLESVAAELVGSRASLDAFAADDPSTDVRSVFSWSYRALSEDAARMFRLLGLHPGPDCSVAAAASLAAVPTDRARALLAELASAHLLIEHSPGRFGFHDLLRAYAVELSESSKDEDSGRAAVHRMLDHYLHTGHAAALKCEPLRDPIDLPQPLRNAVIEPLHEPGALAWLTAELPMLLASVHLAESRGFPRHAWQLAWAAQHFAFRRGYWHEGLAALEAALKAAQGIESRAAQAVIHRGLARYRFRLGYREQSRSHLEQALDLCGDDQVLLARTHRSFALMYGQQHRYADALEHGLIALRIFQQIRHARGEATLLNSVGWYYARLGHLTEALDYCRQAIAKSADLGERIGRANALDSVGYIRLRMRRPAAAVDCFQEAAAVFRANHDRANEADTLTRLGEAHLALGRANEAADAWRRAFELLANVDRQAATRIATKLRDLYAANESVVDSWPIRGPIHQH